LKNTAAKPKQADAVPIKKNVGQIRRAHLKYKVKLFICINVTNQRHGASNEVELCPKGK